MTRSSKKDLYSQGGVHRDLLDSIHIMGDLTEIEDNSIDDPSVDFSNVGIHGVLKAIWKPLGTVVNTTKVPLFFHAVIDSGNQVIGNAGHMLSMFGLTETKGSNAIGQAFGAEVRLEHNCTGGMGSFDFIKIVLGNYASQITDLRLFTFPDLSTIASTAKRTPIKILDPEAMCEFNGGYTAGKRAIGTAAYTLKPSDAGKVISVFAGLACTITCPADMPEGLRFTITALDANDVDFIGTVLNGDGHLKIAGANRKITLETHATGYFVLTGDTKA